MIGAGLLLAASTLTSGSGTPSPSGSGTPNIDESTYGPGTWAFIIFLVLLVAGILLWLSMNRQLKKIPESFDPPEEPPTVEPVAPPAPRREPDS